MYGQNTTFAYISGRIGETGMKPGCYMVTPFEYKGESRRHIAFIERDRERNDPGWCVRSIPIPHGDSSQEKYPVGKHFFETAEDAAQAFRRWLNAAGYGYDVQFFENHGKEARLLDP